MIKPINYKYPSPKELVEYDCKTLEFIQSNMSKIDGGLTSDAKNAAGKYRYCEALSFESSFAYLRDNKYIEVNVGAEIVTRNGNYDKVSYHLLLTDVNNKIYRKFHFDYHPDAKNHGHSIFHFQYGGGLSSKLKGKYSEKDYFPWLKEPRIPFKPMSLALLIHLLFINIEDQEVKKVRDTPEWKSLVRNNELFLWKNFFTNCYTYIKSTRFQSLFDYYCGKC